jgi:hypothetical protein
MLMALVLETFESELERLNATLVLENQSLQHENKQLSMLLKDYEGTLESVMARFRTFAHCTQQHDLQLTRHYESLLDSAAPPQTTLPNGNSNEIPLVQDPTAVEASLFRIASLLRKAYRSLQGEDPSPPSSPSLSEPDSALSLFGIAPAEDLNAKLGGYLALLGAGTRDEVIDNDSLERDIELERLRQENEQLRQMLAISNQDDSSSDFL